MFRKLALALFATLAIALNPLSAQEGNYNLTVSNWPTDLASFDTFRNEQSSTPQGAVVSLIAALDLWTKDEMAGRNALILVVEASHLNADTSEAGYRGFNLIKNTQDLVRRQLQSNPHLIGSYLPGSSTANGYTPSSPPYNFLLTANRFSGEMAQGKIKLFLPSSGASSPRPVTVMKNSKGAWKVSEFSSILVGVAKPKGKPNPADDL